MTEETADARTDDGTGRRTGIGRLTRRHFVATGAVAGAGAIAGCGFLGGNGDGSDGQVGLGDFRGSGPLVEGRAEPGGTSIEDLPDLDGQLNFYLGGGEGGLYLDLIDLLEQKYENFSYNHKMDASRTLANQLIEESEAGTTPADVFIAVDAGSLGAVTNAGATATLSSEVQDAVRSELRTEQWVGIAGRARAVPYNTNQLSASDVPDTVQEFPTQSSLRNAIGWAPTYSAFQSFVTAMRLIRGRSETKAWLESMLDAGVQGYPDEFRVSNSVANGELNAGFANHYYALRVQNARQNAPIDLAFTKGDAGALINVSGAQVMTGSDNQDLAMNFVRHLVSAEAQEFFATRTFAYPTIPGVEPVGGLPAVSELNPPDLSLSKLADTDGTVDLLRETGVLS
ncbi:extracellular solute-binding protein [Halobacteriales archaeon Cl-PHB]